MSWGLSAGIGATPAKGAGRAVPSAAAASLPALTVPCPHSKPLPAHLLHPGLQDGRHSHAVCAVVHGGVRGLPGAGQPRQHPAVHAFHHGESSSLLCPTGHGRFGDGESTGGSAEELLSVLPFALQPQPSALFLFCQVSELVKVSTMSSPKIVLAITDLGLPLGRRVAAKAIAAL